MPVVEPRLFTSIAPFLNAWCLEQPDRPVDDCIAELAGYAGCSPRLMRQIMNGERRLQRCHIDGLIAGLGLDEPRARHVRAMHAMNRAGPEEAARLITMIRQAQADAMGVTWEAPEGQLEDRLPRAFSTAVLGAALAALGPETARALPLAARCVLPLRAEQADEARPELHTPIGPRLVALQPPFDDHACALWHGLLGWAIEALTYARKHRRFVSFVASVDGEAEVKLKEIGRNFRARVVDLCCRHAQRPASVVMGLMFEQQRLVSPPLSAHMGQQLYWHRPGELLLPQDDGDTVDSNMTALPSSDRSPPGDFQPLGYLDLPSAVRAWRYCQDARNKPSSDGYIARRVGVPKATAQDIIYGRVRFGPQHVDGFARLFDVIGDPVQMDALRAMVSLTRLDRDPALAARLALDQRKAAAAKGLRRPETEAWFVASRWYPAVIHAMASLQGFEPSTGWIGRASGGRLTWDAAEQALHALNTLGMLRERPDGRAYGVDMVQERFRNESDTTAAQFNASLLGLLKCELVHMDQHLDLQGYTFALPEAALPELEALIAQIHAEIRAVLAEADARRLGGQWLDRVVVVALQAVPLLHNLSPRHKA